MSKVFLKHFGIEVINTHLSFTETDESAKQLRQVLAIPKLDCRQFVTDDFN